MREVKLGNTIGENYEVLNGLNNGDEIVTNGTFTIDYIQVKLLLRLGKWQYQKEK